MTNFFCNALADFFERATNQKQQIFDLWRGFKGCFDPDNLPKYDCEVLS